MLIFYISSAEYRPEIILSANTWIISSFRFKLHYPDHFSDRNRSLKVTVSFTTLPISVYLIIVIVL